MKTFEKRVAMREAELRYLAEILPQLRDMADNLEETLLSNLLEMAALEASLKLTLEDEYASGDGLALDYKKSRRNVA